MHALSVVCYVLQHPSGYSNETLNWGISSLRKILANGLYWAEDHPKGRGLFRRFRRKLKEVPASPPVIPDRWQLTIDQVYCHDPAGHPTRVKRWASAILSDLENNL